MVKRLLDFLIALSGLILASPVLLPVIALIWLQDRHTPFYVALRVGLGGRPFSMVKLRSMRIGADKTGVDSTSAADSRITPVGHFIRQYKLDEISQLWNVLLGDMSLVGPRPNVERETRLYTAEEKRLLMVKPGITDYASIVFSDEGSILRDESDPDLAYNQLIRPWKSRLGIYYIDHAGIVLDLKLIWLTAIAALSRPTALAAVARDLEMRGAPTTLIKIARRQEKLIPHPPPGAAEVVTSRDARAG